MKETYMLYKNHKLRNSVEGVFSTFLYTFVRWTEHYDWCAVIKNNLFMVG